ncbi:MAG: DUF1538 domain-containing protein [Clostridia bacterium]|nr:DUF1538 domain-containing protein [Clostridia bacterium]
MRILLAKIKEAAFSILPVALLVVVATLTPFVSLTPTELIAFLVSSVFLVVGVALFNLGADLAMSPMGEHIGSGLSKSKKPALLLAVCFLMGVMITVAEPDLSVLAGQIREMIRSPILIGIVGAGVGLFLVLSVLRTVSGKQLSPVLMFFYLVMFALVAVLMLAEQKGFTAVAFDAGGVTTGPITVPFIMALSVGIATTAGRSKKAESSFGSIALCSVGPIIAVLCIGIFSKGNAAYALPDYSIESQLGVNLLHTLADTCAEVALAVGLISAFFFLLQFTVLKLPWKKIVQILFGILYTFIGLVVFMTAVKAGYMPIGFKLGTELANSAHPAVLIGFGFVIGMVTVLAEPAIHVLNGQVEKETDGNISKRSMMIALSAGVGISIGLSMLRIKFGFSILYYLVPGYLISLGLSLLVPGVYTAVAFDSGGVASGPLTSSFILPIAIGACAVLQGVDQVASNGFGIVAMVAMTPLITIQLLGFRAVLSKTIRNRRVMRKLLSADDEQIIEFQTGG